MRHLNEIIAYLTSSAGKYAFQEKREPWMEFMAEWHPASNPPGLVLGYYRGESDGAWSEDIVADPLFWIGFHKDGDITTVKMETAGIVIDVEQSDPFFNNFLSTVWTRHFAERVKEVAQS